MNAIIIQTDNLKISIYMVFIILSFVVGLAAAVVLMRREKTPWYVVISATVLNALMTVFGGVSITMLSSGFRQCGLSSVGGALGVLAATFTITRIIPEYKLQVFRAYSCIIPLMYSVSKLACHFAGCCYGMEYDGVFCLHYVGEAERLPVMNVFPVQMCETLVFAIIFAIGVVLIYVKNAKHSIFMLMCVCSIGKVLLDYLRDSHADNLLIPSLNQIMCVVIVLVGVIFTYNPFIRKFMLDEGEKDQ